MCERVRERERERERERSSKRTVLKWAIVFLMKGYTVEEFV